MYLLSFLQDETNKQILGGRENMACLSWGMTVGTGAQEPLSPGRATQCGETGVLEASASRVPGGRHERVIPTHSIFAKMWVLSDSKTHFHDKTLGKRR